MQDHAVTEAIVAGDPDGISEAYDRYAAPVYAYCHSMLAGPEAAEALLDTFIVAAAKLDGLADPGRLEAWLHAVARNECLRLLEAGARPEAAGPGIHGVAGPDDELAAVTLPVELRRSVVAACTDNSPAGRARRVIAAHRAGPFGPTGFPKPAVAAGPSWWRRVRRRPWVAAAAVLAAVALSAGISAVMTAGSAHRPQASDLGLGGGAAAGSASGVASGGASVAPAHRPSPSASRPAPSAAKSLVTPVAGPSTGRATPTPPVPPSPSPSPPPSPSLSRPPSPLPSRSPSPSPSASPSRGSLLVTPDKLKLVSAKGKPASKAFMLTATGGPVSAFTVTVPAAKDAKVMVSPRKGSLRAGVTLMVTVTVTSKTALNAVLTVAPGNLTVRVTFKV